MKSPAELNRQFRAAGRKMTAQRAVLFEILHDNDGHLSADALFALASARTPGISLRTVYHTLNDLVEMGELTVINVGGRTRFDPNTGAHQHLVCEGCGSITDIYPTTDPLHDVDLHGFAVEHVEVVVRGRCPACAVDRPGPNQIADQIPDQIPNPHHP